MRAALCLKISGLNKAASSHHDLLGFFVPRLKDGAIRSQPSVGGEADRVEHVILKKLCVLYDGLGSENRDWSDRVHTCAATDARRVANFAEVPRANCAGSAVRRLAAIIVRINEGRVDKDRLFVHTLNRVCDEDAKTKPTMEIGYDRFFPM